MNEFIQQLKISIKNNQQMGKNDYAALWRKVKHNVNREALQHSKAMINCCDYFSYELDNVFEN